MRIVFNKNISADHLLLLRNEYLSQLVEPQELYLEMMIWNAESIGIEIENQIAGYVQVKENVLLEYFIRNQFLPVNDIIFSQLLNEFEIKSIYCKSFDQLLLTSTLPYIKKRIEIGYHFRDFDDSKPFIEDESISTRFGILDDIPVLETFMKDIFNDIEELQMVIKNNNLIIFEKDDAIIGFGIFQKTVPNFNWFDIGMAVKPEFRKKGVGTYIISYLKNYCIQRGWKPTCGCDIKNIASKRTLEKAGIYSKHKLYEFEI